MDTEGTLAEEAFLKVPDRTALALAVASFLAVLVAGTSAKEASAVASCRVNPEGIAFVIEGTVPFMAVDIDPFKAVDIDPFKAKDIAPSEAVGTDPSEARGTDPFVAEDILVVDILMVVDIAPFEAEDILAEVDIILAILQGRLDPYLEDKRLH